MRENNSGIRLRPMGLPFMFTLALALMVTMTDCRHLRQQSQSQQQEPALVEDIEDNEIGIDRNQNHHHRPHRPLHEQQQEDRANQEEEEVAGQKDWVKISQAPIALLNEVELGETFEFECEAVGSPAPTVKWLKGSVPLLDEEIFETNMIPMGPSSGLAKVRARLYVRAASKLHHEGDYTCVAESGTQVATAHMRLVVLGNNNNNNLIGSMNGAPSMGGGRNYTSPALLLQRHIKEARAAVHSPPRIVLYDTIYMDNIGSDIVLPCKTAGSPRPSVIWLNPADNIIDNDDLDLGGGGGGSDGRLTVLPDGRLRIRNIRWNDMGPYTCVVTNALGQDNITTFLYPMLAEK